MPDKFDEIMGKWEDHDAERKKQLAAEEEARKRFRDRFIAWANETAKPQMQAIADRVSERGYAASVTVPTAKSPYADLSIEIGPTRANTCELRMSALQADDRVHVQSSGPSGSYSSSVDVNRTYELDALTPEVIDQLTTTLAERAFAPPPS